MADIGETSRMASSRIAPTKANVEEFARCCIVALHRTFGEPTPEEHGIMRALVSAWERKHETCEWTCALGTFIGTECGRKWAGASPGPSTGIYFCFHCGRRIEEVKDAHQD